jgi:polysaccharide export outer membrane protein
MKRALRLVLACLAPAVAACSMLPATGPTSEELIKRARADNELSLRIIDVTPALVPIVASGEAPPAPIRPAAGVPNKIGVDDVLQITVFETGLGLFSSGVQSGTSGNLAGNAIATTLPPVTVASDGTIAIPYVGRIHAAGVSVEDLREYIEDRLAKSKVASQPQVAVNLVSNLSNTVFVSGDVKNPGRYPLTQGPERLLDAVTLAGSTLHLPNDTTVTLTRGESEQRMALGMIDPLSPQNVLLESGDRIYVAYEPRTFIALGASMKPSEVPFDTQRVTLAQALARSSGLNDYIADPAGVYLFRFERADIAKQLGVDATGPRTPIIYRLNLRDPASFLVAQQFQMRDHDLIYIADAKAAQLRKFLEMVSAMFAPLTPASSVSNLTR